MGLVAVMLELLDLAPGTRVLEIGTGSGYNAALLAELVGDPSLVTSLDIDRSLIVDPAAHLDASGHDGVKLICRDAYEGAAEWAPFDRIVAPWGVRTWPRPGSTSWPGTDSRSIPLEHGGVHPLMKVAPTDEGAAGRVVGRSGFVTIQGRRAGRSP